MRGHKVFARIMPQPKTFALPSSLPQANDIFLHALFARVTLTDNSTIEFETKFDQQANTIELYIPPKALNVLNQLTGVQRGPNFKTFINWLIGSRSLVQAAKDLDFIPASELLVWFGATPVLTDNDRLVLDLPIKESSAVGYNLKTNDTFNGSLEISLIWVFMDGSHTTFDIRTSATVSGASGAAPVITTADNTISTINLLPGDIRESTILNVANISPNNIINLLINRNFNGHTDPQTEGVGIVGIRIKLIET
jgi:hypothetical protein